MPRGPTIQTVYVALPGYQAQLDDDAILHSRQKLLQAKKNLTAFVGKCPILSWPCLDEQDTLGYRCKCSFQLIQDGNHQFQYAMRHKGEPVALASSIFPIANRRIQLAMKNLLENVLNACESGKPMYPNLANKGLASLTYAASWNDSSDEEKNSQDCILTLNYNAALENEDLWLEEAKQACSVLKLVQLHGRSRKRLLSAISDPSQASLGSCLSDTVFLFTSTNSEADPWQVSMQQQQSEPQQQLSLAKQIPVFYQKPEGAFFHPNARVMCQALQWMLNRIACIKASSSTNCRLLEMYCGCGAHTLALAKSGMLASIQAVELDQRLVDACKVNIDLNNDTSNNSMTPVQVIRGDAGQCARKYCKKKDFDILLVDPPRQGLDSKVIDLAIQVDSIKHVLIISCGHEALVRDLELLCSHFEVTNCQQLDLFPRTDSVEALVHLERRKAEEGGVI